MSWVSLIALGAAGLASMKAAMERGDIDEASRQGVLAGPAVVEAALASPDRATRLAGIAAAPAVDDRIELLDALAQVAAGPDARRRPRGRPGWPSRYPAPQPRSVRRAAVRHLWSPRDGGPVRISCASA